MHTESRSPMARRARRYLEECATSCPHCEAVSGICRVIGKTTVVQSSDALPELVVGCYCCGCNGEWAERYRLESVTDLQAVW